MRFLYWTETVKIIGTSPGPWQKLQKRVMVFLTLDKLTSSLRFGDITRIKARSNQRFQGWIAPWSEKRIIRLTHFKELR